jgi:hypothetical protein
MENLPLKIGNVLEVAETAVQFLQFPTVSNALLLKSAKFLISTLTTPAELLQFAIDQSGTGQGDTVLQLLALIKDMKPKEKCQNCQEDEEECRNGEPIFPADMFIPGSRVVMKALSSKIYTVVSVKEYTVKYVQCTDNKGKEDNFPIYFQAKPSFCYKCN